MKGILQLEWINELETNSSITMLKSEIGHQCEVINLMTAVLLPQGRNIEKRVKIRYRIGREQIMEWS